MQKKHRLRERSDFRKVFDRGSSFANRYLVVYCMRHMEGQEFRVGFSVSKKVGNAVVRNRIKRRLKECVRELAPLVNKDADFIVIARPSVVTLEFVDLRKNVRHLLNGVNLLKKRTM